MELSVKLCVRKRANDRWEVTRSSESPDFTVSQALLLIPRSPVPSFVALGESLDTSRPNSSVKTEMTVFSQCMELNKFLRENSGCLPKQNKTKESMVVLSTLDCVHQGAGLGPLSSVAARPPSASVSWYLTSFRALEEIKPSSFQRQDTKDPLRDYLHGKLLL